MAFNYASYAVPQGYTGKAAIGENFKSGFDATRALVNEADAAATLSKFAESLYGGAAGGSMAGATPGQPQLLSELAKSADPGNQMIAGSQQAATNATDPALANYFASIKGAESSGDPNAKNPNSSATGLYQITDGTWQGLAQKHPDLGLTPDGRTDPMQQEKAVRALTTDNMMALRQSGQPVNPGTLYAAHFLGASGASQVLGLPDTTPMVSAVPPEVLRANPNLQGMNVGDFKAWANQQGGSGSGGYRPPMEQPQQTADASGGAGGLPPREVLQAMFANPDTRQMAIDLVKNAQTGAGGGKPIEINGQLVDPATGKVLGDYRTKDTTASPPTLTSIYDANGREQKGYMNGSTFVPVGSPKATTERPEYTANQATAAGYADRMYEADRILSEPSLQAAQLDVGQAAKGAVPLVGNMLTSSEFQQADQAQRNFINAILRRESGAAIATSEFDSAKKQYFPQPGDSAEVLTQKKFNRANAINGVARSAGPAYQPPSLDVPTLDGADKSSPPPPPSYDGDPALWQYLTPEQRALWQ